MKKITGSCEIKKIIGRTLTALCALVAVLSFAGCEKAAETNVSSETLIQTAASEAAPKEPAEPIGEDSYGSPAYPLPDDWTFEKIVNLIEIDGVPLSLSSVPEDFNNINKKIKSEWDENFITYYDVYYEDEIIMTAEKIDEKPINYIRVGYFDNNQEINAITFAGYSLREINEVYEYMDTNFNVSQSGECGKRYSFINDNDILEIGFVGDFYEKPTAVSIIVGIREAAEEAQIQTIASETTSASSSKPKEPVEPIGEDSYGSPAYPLPDDWTFEKIVNLIEIEGVPLSLSSVPEDFNNINKKIKSEWDENFTIYYDVYFEYELILTVRKSKDESFDGAMLGYSGNNQEIIDAMTFAGYSLREINGIYEYMDTNFNVSRSGESGKRYSFINDGSVLEIGFYGDNFEKSTQVMIIVRLYEVKE